MKKRKYFVRIFDIYAATILLYTVFTLCAVIFQNGQYANKQITVDKQSILEQSRQKGDMSFSIAGKLVRQLTFDKDLVNYVVEDTPQARATLHSKMTRDFSSFYEAGFNIAIMNGDTVIGKDGIRSANNFLTELSIDADDYRRALETLGGKTQYAAVKSGDASFTVITRDRVAYSRDLFFFLTFYNEVMLPSTEGGGDFAILSLNGPVASIGGFFENDESSRIFPTERDGQFKLRGHTIYAVNSTVFENLKYVYAAKISLIPLETVWTAVISLIVMILLGAFVAVKGSAFLYKPVREILREFSPNDEVDDEIRFISDILSDIKIANERLTKTVRLRENELKSKCLFDLSMGILSDEDIISSAEKYSWSEFESKGLIAAVIECGKMLRNSGEIIRAYAPAIRFSVYQTLREELFEACGAEVFELSERRYGILFPAYDAARTEEIKKILSDKINNLQYKYDIGFTAAVGSPQNGLRGAAQSFREAMYALEYSYSMGGKVVITGDDVKKAAFTSYYYPLDIESSILLYMKENNWEKGRRVLIAVLDKNLKDLALGHEEITEFKFAVVSTIKRALQIVNKTVSQIFGEGGVLYLELNMCENSEELYVKILEIFDRLAECLAERDAGDVTLIDKILDYIHKNYNRDISLLDVAEEFHISTYYVSRLFKTKLNLNFNDYRNGYRIKMAIEMINGNSKIKVAELAQALDFATAESFNRVFKKHAGVSPGEYIKKTRKN